jgi:hypothetical protein
MKKFLVLYKAPVSVIEEWMKTDEATRKSAEEKMQADWQTWMQAHGSHFKDMTAGVGKTKQVTSEGITNIKNDIMLSSVIEAESPEEAAKIFEGHPHFGIPEATIEVSEMHSLSGMQ